MTVLIDALDDSRVLCHVSTRAGKVCCNIILLSGARFDTVIETDAEDNFESEV